MQRTKDRQFAGVEIEIGPLQAEEFALPHAGSNRENVESLVAVAADGLQERARFGGREETDLRELFHLVALGGAHAGRRRVGGDVLPIHRELQGASQHRVRVLRGSGREAFLGERAGEGVHSARIEIRQQ